MSVHLRKLLFVGSLCCFIPLTERTDYVSWFVGPYGATREPIFEWFAAGSPERVRALLEAGRPVYVEMMQPVWSQAEDSLDLFLADFEVVPVWRLSQRPALAELRLR